MGRSMRCRPGSASEPAGCRPRARAPGLLALALRRRASRRAALSAQKGRLRAWKQSRKRGSEGPSGSCGVGQAGRAERHVHDGREGASAPAPGSAAPTSNNDASDASDPSGHLHQKRGHRERLRDRGAQVRVQRADAGQRARRQAALHQQGDGLDGAPGPPAPAAQHEAAGRLSQLGAASGCWQSAPSTHPRTRLSASTPTGPPVRAVQRGRQRHGGQQRGRAAAQRHVHVPHQPAVPAVVDGRREVGQRGGAGLEGASELSKAAGRSFREAQALHPSLHPCPKRERART